MLPRLGVFVRGFLLAPEYHHHAALRVELDDHVRALVDGPDVVVLVDADVVRERPRVQVLADLADELAVRPELEQLRRGGAVGRSGRVAAIEDEDVLLRFIATPETSPRFMSAGSFRKLGTESNGISGTAPPTSAPRTGLIRRAGERQRHHQKLFHGSLLRV